MTVRTIASIQARTGSSRLPGKVLLPLGGQALLDLIVTRLKSVTEIDEIVIATTNSKADDKIVSLFEEDCAIKLFRGSENDVLSRLATLGRRYPDCHHLELFGDSPLICTDIIRRAIKEAKRNPAAIVTNARQNLFPHGMEFLIYPFELLIACDEKVATDDPLREHGGSNLLLGDVNDTIDLPPLPCEVFEEIYLEIDEPSDYAVLSAIVDILKEKSLFPYFTLPDILHVIRESSQIMENKGVERRWRKVQAKF